MSRTSRNPKSMRRHAVSVWLSPEEYALVQRAAQAARRPTSQWARNLILDAAQAESKGVA